MRKVLYVAAHGGFREAVPLGGGKAVADRLMDEWRRTRPFDLELVSPAILGDAAPRASDLVRFGEREYAAFCRRFESAATAYALRHDPAATVVLANDVSEGPDFAALAARGYRIATIFHVDVVAYVARMYLRGIFRPRTLARLAARLAPFLPEVARLIFLKQRESLRHSRAVVVPSAGVRGVLLDTYGDLPRERVRVIEWGAMRESAAPESVEREAGAIRREYGLTEDAFVILTLSRISPEKGIDLLLDALSAWERHSGFPSRPVVAVVCGEAAFMNGPRYERRLRRMAARLRKIRVVFPGFVTGARKQAFFRLASVYVFPSKHESYGLTLMEALASGVPAVCVEHHGARSIVRPEFGDVVPPGQLREALARLEAGAERRERMAAAAREFASRRDFSLAAAELARLLLEL